MMHLPALIEALSYPTAYPHPVEKVEVRQTHISVVFLAGPYVYKLKKPVNLGFLDFTTLAKRLDFCQEEVRLNRRLAPEIYLGVIPVVRSPEGVHFEGDGEVVEWAVKMQRLPDEATLHERLRREDISVEVIQLLARKIASFHQKAEINERIAAFGRFEGVARIIRDVLSQSVPQVGITVSRVVFDRIQTLTEETLSRLHPLIESRAGRGIPCDTHGDLHLDHIYYFPDKKEPADLVIIDCIEFNERFRFTDPVADMAFAAMDLAFHGRRDLACAFIESYFRATGDAEGRRLLPLYMAYRATVRGSVEGILLTEKEVPQSERSAALERAKAHWLLALTELEEPIRRPCLLLVAGLPGTGKSTLARGLGASAGFTVLRSDVVRKDLAGLSFETLSSTPLPERLYSRQLTERTYSECLRRAEGLLFEGKRVLVDATFREEGQRRAFLELAVRRAVPAGLLVCQAEPTTVRKRLEERHADASDADWSVYLKLAKCWEEVGPTTLRASHTIATESSPEHVLFQALDALREWGLRG